MENIILQYDNWYILLCLLAGFVYAFALYYKQRNLKDKSPILIWVLSILRFISVSAISFLLLSPLFKYITEQKSKPVVVVAQDYSSSLKNSYTDQELKDFNNKIHQLKSKLSSKYDVQEFSLGSELIPGLKDSFGLNSTNISQYIGYLNQSYDEKELSAIILSTDGIYNEGNNPDYMNIGFNAPIYTIALGDTSEQQDILISEIYYNDIAFLDDVIGIKADIKAKNFKGKRTTLYLYSISSNGQKKLLDKKNISINSENFFHSEFFTVEAKLPGNSHFRISTTRLENEISYKNNSKDIYIQVIDSRVKILVLANNTHPDLGTLKELLSSNKNYEVSIKYKDDSFSPNSFDLIIYHNLPSDKFDISSIHDKATKLEIPEFFIYGTQTSQNRFNKTQNLVSVKGNSTSTNDVQAVVNDDFKLFIIDDFSDKGLDRFPPLLSPFGEYQISPDTRVLLYQKINKIDTKYPLLVTNTRTKNKTAVLLGSNIFKWRLYDYLQNENNDITKSIFSQIVQYLTVKKDKSQWRVKNSKNLYYNTEPILFTGELYNDNFELINKPEAYLKITDNHSKEFDFVFTREDNRYSLNAGQFPVGNYRFIANVKYNGKSIVRKGKFDIQEKDLEKFDLVARHDLLSKLSSKTNGKLFYKDQIDDLTNMLNSKDVKPIMYYGQTTKKLIDFRWLFAFFLLLLSIEWFIRRYNGTF